MLVACSTYDPPSAAEGRIVSPDARPGLGFIANVSVVPDNTYRLFINMDNGGTQDVDVDNPTFFPGERVQVTADRRVVRISATTLSG